MAVRYNAQYDKLLTAWISVILGDKNVLSLQALGINAGVDAIFTIGRKTGFTARSK